MGLFDHARDDALVILKSEISDLRAQLRAERAQHDEEKLRLLDRIIALTQPGAHRELHPRPQQVAQRLPARRAAFPGNPKSFRPPVNQKLDPSDYYPSADEVGEPDVDGTPEAKEPS